MSTYPGTPGFPVSASGGSRPSSQALTRMRRIALGLFTPVVIYGLVRPHVSSDAVGLAIAGAIPTLYSVVLAVARRRVDYVMAFSASGFALACAISLLAGGSSLPLKLGEAPITFAIGVVLLVATLISRPVPLARLLRVPIPSKQIDSSLSAMVGGFLVLHAMLMLTLAVSLSTSSYLLVSKVAGWGTLVLGILALRRYLRSPGVTAAS
jgi:hypothetical protein